jgi:uncharacterized protein YmfQ (DUF2313 family)
MSLEKTTELYASVLRQLLPEGVYDTAEQTHVADDVYAHAKVLAQADIDAHRLLQVLEAIPVDLLADYEREYGLPMQCMVPGTQSIEERINVLRWVRTNRNVLNRSYVEQLLAIFGVTLVDIIKYFPMQCTAPCNAPVNTEQLRYKVFLRFQYPMTADMSCIIENYLPAYLRIDWVVDMPWGEWILNSEVTFTTNSTAHYTAYKTNQREYYDSYAELDLTGAIVKSLSDADMQQWQAVTDAIRLLGGSSWSYDQQTGDFLAVPVNTVKCTTTQACEGYPYIWTPNSGPQMSKPDCNLLIGASGWWGQTITYQVSDTRVECRSSDYSGYRAAFDRNNNPNYNPSNDASIRLTAIQVAQQIISNTLSTDQGISLLAEAYRENVAKSLFSTDPAKQFVKRLDLISQFEQNKVLRT